VINRFDEGDDGVEEYCRELDIHVIARIPHRRRMAEVYSRGGTLLEAIPELTDLFREIPGQIEGRLS